MRIGGDGFAAIADEIGFVLLHCAAANRVSKEVMQHMIQLHPPALMKVGEENNWLPLHFACYFNRRAAAVSLTAAFPAALSMKNISNERPLDVIGREVDLYDTDMQAIMKAHFSNKAVLIQ